MAVVKVENKTYTTESLYQWDQNQVLEIRGLSLAKVPEIHFTNAAMSRAIVRQAAMNAAGVITVDVPNTMLQVAGKMAAYICTYEGGTFQTLYKLEIPVKARPQPADYVFQDTAGEVYSYNALENMVVNAETELRAQYGTFTKQTTESYNKFTADNAAALQGAMNEAAEAKNAATASAASAASAAAATVEAVNTLSQGILKSDIVEILKVETLPDTPDASTLYIIV